MQLPDSNYSLVRQSVSTLSSDFYYHLSEAEQRQEDQPDLTIFFNLATSYLHASPRYKIFPGQEIGKPAVSEVPDWPYNT